LARRLGRAYIGDNSMKRQAKRRKRRVRPTKDASFTMRMKETSKDIIDAAAARAGVSMAAFMERAGLKLAAETAGEAPDKGGDPQK
jgi:predicted HicB family RNase H-like nuclease